MLREKKRVIKIIKERIFQLKKYWLILNLLCTCSHLLAYIPLSWEILIDMAQTCKDSFSKCRHIALSSMYIKLHLLEILLLVMFQTSSKDRLVGAPKEYFSIHSNVECSTSEFLYVRTSCQRLLSCVLKHVWRVSWCRLCRDPNYWPLKSRHFIN
jgi:hypothetical protein